MRTSRTIIAVIVILVGADARAGLPKDIGVQGGLAVVIGSDVDMVHELGKNEKFLVQMLDTDESRVAAARTAIQRLGLYGRVSSAWFDGARLPYADNLVNLVVVRSGRVSAEEIRRVLAPRGVALGSRLGDRYVKPVPETIDEWTHYLYDPKNNAVSHDDQIATPKRLQWDSGPQWSRHHDHMSSISGVVSANGRIFTILDEGSRMSIQLPADWKVVARDAFNGKLLWKRSIPEWHTTIWPAKSGPAQLPRRIVAVGDEVYVTLGLHAPVSVLDAATGKTLRTLKNTQHTEEILVQENYLIIAAHMTDPPDARWKLDTVRCWTEARRAKNSRPWQWNMGDPKKIIVLNAESGDVRWSKDASIAPITLGADGTHVVYSDGQNVICLAQDSGKELWRSKQTITQAVGTQTAPNLVIYGDVVLYSAKPGRVTSLSIRDGRTLWSKPHGPTGHQSTCDLLVADGLVWSTTPRGKGRAWTYTGRDPVTGADERVFPPGQSDWFHHRCHRGRGTDNYLIMARTGIEYIDLETGNWQPNPWVRGACLYGYLPANGLTYAPPHPCGCYIESKLTGFNALAPAGPKRPASGGVRLVKGPAFGKVADDRPTGKEDWPTYRSNNARSGSTATGVPAAIAPEWESQLGGKISPVTIANGRVFASAVDRHRVYSLDAATGETVWTYTAGGRVDTPPTVYRGMAIFGCRDGWVYAVRVADGQLVWRFRAAPEDRMIVSCDQLESAWPVNGAVLVQDGSVFGVAGRSMFLDGGIHFFRLNAVTGEKQIEEIMDDKIPGSDQPLDTTAKSLDMPVAMADILSSDGQRLYMRSQAIGMDGKRGDLTATAAHDQGGEQAHLICSSGYLDSNWFHRAYWVFGRGYGTGHNGWFRAGRFAPAGRLLVFDDQNIFGYGRLPNMYVWSSVLEYQLYSARKDVTDDSIGRVLAANQRQESNDVESGGHGHEITFDRRLYGSYPLKEISAIAFNWRNLTPPVIARAMTLAGDKLFVAGPPDLLDEETIFARPFDARIIERAKAQQAAIDGKKGAKLQVISTTNGERLNEIQLDTTPVFDGMAAANGKLYLSTTGGSVVCFQSK